MRGNHIGRRSLNLTGQHGSRRVVGGPNEAIVSRVQPYFKTSHPLEPNNGVLVSQVKNDKGAVSDPTTVKSQV